MLSYVMSDPILELRNLKMHFPLKGGVFSRQIAAVKAVDGVSLTIAHGETLGLVGESGCGKSTLGKSIVRLTKPTAGSVIFEGDDITRFSQRKLRPLRCNMQMVFQDPAESLNSRMSVGQIISEPLEVQGIGNKVTRREMVGKLLERVGMPSSAAQRLNPDMIVLDEPVSALDVSVQSQVLNLLLDLQQEYNMAYLFIAHDLAVVKHISDRIAVMYLGKIVELADADAIYENPRHAYTKALISAIPVPDPTIERPRVHLEGEVPSPINPPKGSAFGHRINHPQYEQTIGMEMPLVEIEQGHWVAADPCCLSEQDYLAVSDKLSSTIS
jgi:peptide/nickel transport system ATP-binding protein/oligopeptide transport system ATP-binding protein